MPPPVLDFDSLVSFRCAVASLRETFFFLTPRRNDATLTAKPGDFVRVCPCHPPCWILIHGFLFVAPLRRCVRPSFQAIQTPVASIYHSVGDALDTVLK